MAEVIGQRENNMIAGNKEDRKWRWVFLFLLLFLSQKHTFFHILKWVFFFFFFLSDKKVEGDDGVRTVECLRGRLVAERQASKVAKENADLLGNKVMFFLK